MKFSRQTASAAFLLAVFACGETAPVAFRPDLSADYGPEITLSLVPYDTHGLLDSLETAARTPAPSFPELLDTLRLYTPPDPAEARDIYQLWVSVRNRVRATSDSLYRIADRDSPEYRDLYARFRDRYDGLREREASLIRAMNAVSANHAQLASRAAAAADSVRAWEADVLRDFDSLATVLETASGRNTFQLTMSLTEQTWAEVPAGAWWFTARVPHTSNPFFEYQWQGVFHVSGGLPVSVPVTDRHVTLEWRH